MLITGERQMQFKLLRELEADIMSHLRAAIGPNFNDSPISNLSFMVQEVALLLTDAQYEIDSLRYKYNIEEKDLLPMLRVLSRGESIPARIAKRAMETKR
jgi:hypothetical protein